MEYRSKESGITYDLYKERDTGKMLLLAASEGEEKKICFEEK